MVDTTDIWLEPEVFKETLKKECGWFYNCSQLENVGGIIKGPVSFFSTIFWVNYDFFKKQLRVEVDFSTLFNEVNFSAVENTKIFQVLVKNFGKPVSSNLTKMETVDLDYSIWFYPIFFLSQRPILELTFIDVKILFLWGNKKEKMPDG